MSFDDRQPWETSGDLPWDAPTAEHDLEDAEAWRGEVHLADWPEELAGPEYWLFKNLRDR